MAIRRNRLAGRPGRRDAVDDGRAGERHVRIALTATDEAIHAAAAGDALIAPNVTRRLLATFADRAPAAPVQPIDPLTEREEEVLVLVARGWTNAEIARELYVSLSTVKSHVASLMAKLGVRNRVEIAMWAYQTHRV